jgi:hypothetical protein
MKEIIYNVPVEVNQEQYNILMNIFSGIVAGRKTKDKYFIKVLIPNYTKHVQEYFNTSIS